MTKIILNDRDALIHVDPMSTFMPGGGLPVADGDLIVPVLKKLDKLFPKARRFASREAHPVGHIGNASSYVGVAPYTALTPELIADWTDANLAPTARFTLGDVRAYVARFGALTAWPDHGQAGTEWERLHPDLDEGGYAFVQVKGDDPLLHPFSALCDEYGRPLELLRRLKDDGIDRVFVDGLALDFCVLATLKDALAHGFETYLVLDGTRAVFPDQVPALLDRLANLGAKVVCSTWFN